MDPAVALALALTFAPRPPAREQVPPPAPVPACRCSAACACGCQKGGPCGGLCSDSARHSGGGNEVAGASPRAAGEVRPLLSSQRPVAAAPPVIVWSGQVPVTAPQPSGPVSWGQQAYPVVAPGWSAPQGGPAILQQVTPGPAPAFSPVSPARGGC